MVKKVPGKQRESGQEYIEEKQTQISENKFEKYDKVYENKNNTIRAGGYTTPLGLKYVSLRKNAKDIHLDGNFTINELRYFIKLMEESNTLIL